MSSGVDGGAILFSEIVVVVVVGSESETITVGFDEFLVGVVGVSEDFPFFFCYLCDF